MRKPNAKYAMERSLKNISLFNLDIFTNNLDNYFDFIHSYIVFQHIPRRKGLQLLKLLLNKLETGGICAIHFTYSKMFIQKNLMVSTSFQCTTHWNNFYWE